MGSTGRDHGSTPPVFLCHFSCACERFQQMAMIFCSQERIEIWENRKSVGSLCNPHVVSSRTASVAFEWCCLQKGRLVVEPCWSKRHNFCASPGHRLVLWSWTRLGCPASSTLWHWQFTFITFIVNAHLSFDTLQCQSFQSFPRNPIALRPFTACKPFAVLEAFTNHQATGLTTIFFVAALDDEYLLGSVPWMRPVWTPCFAVLDFVELKVFAMWTKVGLGNMAQNVFGFSFSAQYSVLGIRIMVTIPGLESSCRRRLWYNHVYGKWTVPSFSHSNPPEVPTPEAWAWEWTVPWTPWYPKVKAPGETWHMTLPYFKFQWYPGIRDLLHF